MDSHSVYILFNAFSNEHIEALCRECDVHTSVISEDILCDQACAIDLFENSSLPDQSNVRESVAAYINERWRNVKPDTEIDRKHIQEAIFEILPGLIKWCLSMNRPKVDDLYLFNEHYIFKPPHSNIEFGWHVDEDKQMGLTSDDISYVSAWCALDSMLADNGSLIIPSSCNIFCADTTATQNHTSPNLKRKHLCESDILYKTLGEDSYTLLVPAGTVVLFSSKLLHRSGPNLTVYPRRVFYAQYSERVITGKQPLLSPVDSEHNARNESNSKTAALVQPLCFAVRLTSSPRENIIAEMISNNNFKSAEEKMTNIDRADIDEDGKNDDNYLKRKGK